MQKIFKLRGAAPLLAIAAIAAIPRLFPQATQQVVNTAKAITHTDTFPDSEYYQLVPGSVYDGDTLRVTNGSKELKIRLCGIDAPEKDRALGIEVRDHLRSLIDQGDDTLIVLPVEQDRYGRTVAEIFVPVAGQEAEIHLNSQMTYDGYAYHYEQYSDSCPNGRVGIASPEVNRGGSDRAEAGDKGGAGVLSSLPPTIRERDSGTSHDSPTTPGKRSPTR